MSFAYRTPLPVLLRVLDSRDLEELWAYHQARGFGERRADLRAAMVAYAAAQPHCAERLDLDTFLLRDDLRDAPHECTADEVAAFRQWEADIKSRLPGYKREQPNDQ